MTMPLQFCWKREEPPVGTMDARSLLPELYPGASIKDLASNKIAVGSREYRWDDLFEILGDNQPMWSLPGNPNYLHLGSGMSKGGLTVEGHAGDYAGLQMRGGTLCLEEAGHRLGAGMAGGFIRVEGNVGSELAGPTPHAFEGMTDGEIHVAGSTGPRAGYRCRRGLILVRQAVEEAAYDLQAGTLVIEHGPWHHPGMHMKRGTLLCLDVDAAPGWLPYFQPDAVFQPVIVRMILKHLVSSGYVLPEGAMTAKYQQYSGDRLNGNKGEILHRVG